MSVTFRRFLVPALLGLAVVVPGQAFAVVWQNETDTPLECDYCALQFPAVTSINEISDPIFGRIFESGVTESPGPSASVLAQVGIGPVGTDPRTTPGWVWLPAAFSIQVGNDDEYSGTVQGFSVDQQSYTFRFSFDGGQSFTLADLDGAGSNPGLSFSSAALGLATVTAAVPEPSTYAMLASGLVLLGYMARRRTHESAHCRQTNS